MCDDVQATSLQHRKHLPDLLMFHGVQLEPSADFTKDFWYTFLNINWTWWNRGSCYTANMGLAICVCVFDDWKSGGQQHQVDQLHFIFFFLFHMVNLPFQNRRATAALLAVSSEANICKLQSSRRLSSRLNKTCNSVKPIWTRRKDKTVASPWDPRGGTRTVWKDRRVFERAAFLAACSTH